MSWRPGPLPVQELARVVELLLDRPSLQLELDNHAAAMRLRHKFYAWRADLRRTNYAGLAPQLAGTVELLEVTVHGSAVIFRKVGGEIKAALERVLAEEASKP